MPRPHRYWLICAWFAAHGAVSAPLAGFSEQLTAVCRQLDRNLTCRLLPRTGAEILAAEITRPAAAALPAQLLPRPDRLAAAVLLLVDTSDPGRAAVVGADRDNLRTALRTFDSRLAVGVARFDAELELLLPPAPAADRTQQKVDAAIAAIRATGRTTEFYRNLIAAIRLLARGDAAARALVVMSDGLAEDSAYHHEDAVAAAHREGVTLHGIGHARSVTQSVALQTLRRLSEETGGLYLQADSTSHRVPAAHFARIAAALEAQRTARFDLGALAAEPGALAAAVNLRVLTSEGTVDLPIEIQLPRRDAPAPTPAAPPAAAPQPTSVPDRPDTPPAPPPPPAATPRAPLDWIALLVFVLLGIYLAWRWRRGGPERAPAASHDGADTDDAPRHAFIMLADDTSQRFAITRTPWRVGRSRSNDLTLDDGSVSRVHAEIHRDELGIFTIQDLDAMNGVFVNDKKVETAVINEGDRIDIGDIGLRFTLHGDDYDSQDPTILVRTRTPGPDAAP